MPNKMKVWYWAARPFTLSASIIPVLAGSALAFLQEQFNPFLFVLIMVASVLVQAGANMVDEFSDHTRPEGNNKLLATYKVIALGLLSSRAVKLGATVCFGIATAIGLYLITIVGWPLLVICLASIAVAYFHAAGPKPLGSIGLGHMLVFIFMGPVMVIGSNYVQTQILAVEAFWLSLPVGCTVTAILVANDLRDLEEDKAAGKITTITLFGRFFGHLEWIILVAVSFLTITILAFAGGKLLYLLPLLAIFQAIRAFRLVWLAAERTAMAQGLRATSRLHLEIGLLLSLGVVLSKFISS